MQEIQPLMYLYLIYISRVSSPTLAFGKTGFPDPDTESPQKGILFFLLPFSSPELIYERVGLSVYVACHIFALCPACVNPIIYGYLNENFRKVYKNISISMKSFRD